MLFAMKKSRRVRLVLLAWTVGLIISNWAWAAEAPARLGFSHDILPILKARCAECHTNGKYKGSMSLDNREELLKTGVALPGKSGESELLRRVSTNDPGQRMPPKGKPLTAREVSLLRAWIDQGLPWEKGFSFKASTYVPPLKPRQPALPPARAGREHPIDRILDDYFARHQVQPPAPLDDTAFVRRIFLDVIGLLPAPEDVDAFSHDPAPDRRTRLIRRLLAENRLYTEHWLTFWNDLLRNDYRGTGYIDGGREQITGWLIASLLENKPYDRMVRELISPTRGAEGFVKGIKWRGRVNASQVPELQFSQNISQVFFGINMKCASCHDSFIDRWKLDDAYGLAAVVADKPLEIHRCDKPTGQFARPRFLFPELGEVDGALPRARRLEQLALLVTHPENGRFTRTLANRFWQRLLGRGIVHPVDVMANRPWSEELLDYLAGYLAEQKYDLKKLLEHILTSQAYQSRPVVLAQEPSAEDYVFRGPELRRLTAEQFLDTVWQTTRAGPVQPVERLTLGNYPESVPVERRLVRASLVPADPLMRSLGRPNREQVVTTRPDQLTTLQALDLANGPILAGTLARGAANLLQTHPGISREKLIKEIYRRALCRRPTEEELSVARELTGSPPTPEGVADLLWTVFLLPEFQLLR